MTDTQMVTDKVAEAIYNQGKVTPEMVEAVAKIVASVGCKNCREKWQMYRDDAIEIVQTLGLGVGNE